MMRRRLLLFSALVLCTMMVFGARGRQFTLVIDAGHGGKDHGAPGAFSKEKDINLNVALAFGRYVERNCSDVKVIYTRKTDVFIPLDGRADIANRNKADLFVSIHTNALPKGRIARGVETYTLGMHRASENLEVAKRENSVILVEDNYQQKYEGFNPNSPESYIMFEFLQDKNMAQSVDLAKEVQRHVCSHAGRANKGVHQAGFLVLRKTSMPSCLIELGFITTPDEERFLNSANGIDRMAKGIYNAFVAYRNRYDKNVSVPLARKEKAQVEVPQVLPERNNGKQQAVPDTVPSRPEGESKKNSAEPQKDNAASQKNNAEPQKNNAEPQKDNDAPQPATPINDGQQEQAQPDVKPAQPSAPVFKVQVMATGKPLKKNDNKLKGLTDVDFYEEGGMYKYTCGSSEDYNEISRLRKSILNLFPQAFIIAFKDGQKVNVNDAVREFSRLKQRK